MFFLRGSTVVISVCIVSIHAQIEGKGRGKQVVDAIFSCKRDPKWHLRTYDTEDHARFIYLFYQHILGAQSRRLYSLPAVASYMYLGPYSRAIISCTSRAPPRSGWPRFTETRFSHPGSHPISDDEQPFVHGQRRRPLLQRRTSRAMSPSLLALGWLILVEDSI